MGGCMWNCGVQDQNPAAINRPQMPNRVNRARVGTGCSLLRLLLLRCLTLVSLVPSGSGTLCG